MPMTSVPLRSMPTQLALLGAWVSPLGLRLLLAWEFFESGLEKWRGENWFAAIQDDFPLPFNLIPADLNWSMAATVELVGAACLLFGLATRLAAASLLLVTVVATAAVHWPMDWDSLRALAMGYAITDGGFGNYKLPLLFMAMLLPLLFNGGGRLSVDALLCGAAPPALHPASAPLLLVAMALPLAWLLPALGLASLGAGVARLAWLGWRGRRDRTC